MQAGQEPMLLRDILRRSAKRYSKKTALIDGDVRRTYGEANERIHRLASGLLSLGLSPGDHIAILANNPIATGRRTSSRTLPACRSRR